MFPGSQVRVVQCRRKKQRAGGGRPPGIPQIPAARCGPEVEVWRCGGVAVWRCDCVAVGEANAGEAVAAGRGPRGRRRIQRGGGCGSRALAVRG